ncbi:MAG: exonuclease domain-containing protein [Treponema sp.]|nr:exonuclease domain-containing protein [Treponema sp.]
MNVIIWDTETNGLEKHNSVLSISAIKCSLTIEDGKVNSDIIEKYDRFYFRKPGEAVGKEAINVNGLTDNVIKERRGSADYPEHFCDDIQSFRRFCSDTNHFVGHNIFYDTQYINFWLNNVFCTMLSNNKIIGLKRRNGQPKFPSLNETANFYGVEIDKNELHGSMYDSFITYQIFLKMLEHKKVKAKVLEFLR